MYVLPGNVCVLEPQQYTRPMRTGHAAALYQLKKNDVIGYQAGQPAIAPLRLFVVRKWSAIPIWPMTKGIDGEYNDVTGNIACGKS